MQHREEKTNMEGEYLVGDEQRWKVWKRSQKGNVWSATQKKNREGRGGNISVKDLKLVILGSKAQHHHNIKAKPDLLKAFDQIVRVVRESWELEEPDDQVPVMTMMTKSPMMTLMTSGLNAWVYSILVDGSRCKCKMIYFNSSTSMEPPPSASNAVKIQLSCGKC